MRTFKITLLATFKYKISSINYSHHAVNYIPMTYLFYNWKSVPFDLLHPFLTPPTLRLWQPPICSLYVRVHFEEEGCLLAWFCLWFYIPHLTDIIRYLSFCRGSFITYSDPMEIKTSVFLPFFVVSCFLLSLSWSVNTMPSLSSFSCLLLCHPGPSSHLFGLCFFSFTDHMWTRKIIIKMICCFS